MNLFDSQLFRFVSLVVATFVAATVFSGCSSAPSTANNQPPGLFWDKSNESNPAIIDHSVWDQILGIYVVESENSGVRQFRYSNIDSAASKQMEGYVKYLTSIDPRGYNKLEQQAYWMNLYNVVSVQAVRENLPAITSGNGLPVAFLAEKRIKVADQRLSLADIEDNILRPIWKDHRIHFGLNCASMDCPNMDRRAYTAATIKAQLKEAGMRFVNDDRGVRYTDGKLTVSRLFDIYRNDFAEDPKTLMKVFAHYARDKKALYLLGYQGEIYYSEDMRLNTP